MFKKSAYFRFTRSLAHASIQPVLLIEGTASRDPSIRITGVADLMETRISGGSLRGRQLRVLKTSGLRPTSERVRSAVFSLLGIGAVERARVLDLYAGTGALGIEAISRGAAFVDFVEADPRLGKNIKDNLRELGIESQGHVYISRVERALDIIDGIYSIVFADPPYDLDPWPEIMMKLDAKELLQQGALIVAEHRENKILADCYGSISALTTRKYGDTSITVYRYGDSRG